VRQHRPGSPKHTAVPFPSDHEIRRARQTFRWKLGRDPGPEDPTFILHDAAGRRLMTDAEIDAAVMVAMRRAGVHPAFIYAYHRCGFLLTEERLQASTEEERASPSGADPSPPNAPDDRATAVETSDMAATKITSAGTPCSGTRADTAGPKPTRRSGNFQLGGVFRGPGAA
jgi:hypothetical protein